MCAMIPDLEAHFREFIPPRDELLRRLEGEAQRENIPIIGPVVGELLLILARVSQARHVLELGTATGYSAIYLARGMEPQQGRVTTLELDEGMAARARANFVAAGVADRVEVRVGEALSLMAGMTGPFDLIFMDIDKESYLPALDPLPAPHKTRRPPGGRQHRLYGGFGLQPGDLPAPRMAGGAAAVLSPGPLPGARRPVPGPENRLNRRGEPHSLMPANRHDQELTL